MKKVLTIAGSDSGGGAGIQADLKTFAALGVYGMSAITALTAQNTVGVHGVVEIEPDFVAKQIDSVVTDIGADAVKTGMLANSGIIHAVARKIREHRLRNVVVDPVMIAKSGDPLLRSDAQKALKEGVIPLADVVTPNLNEAGALSGVKIEDIDGMKEAARIIHRLGAKNTVVKGGHLPGNEAVDILYDGRTFREYRYGRIDTKNTHGTGCTFASAIAAGLAKGASVEDAVGQAKGYVAMAIRYSLSIGRGHGPTNHFASLYRESEKYALLQDVKGAVLRLKISNVGKLIPEVQSNLSMALTDARSIEDVAGIPGRIIRIGESVATLADPDFGISSHVARIILTAMKYNPEMRSAMNIRYSEEIVKSCREAGFRVASFSRDDEPGEVQEREGSSLVWGVSKAIEACGYVPDVIYDEGGVGKEAMVRVLGRTAGEVAEKVVRVAEGLEGRGKT